MLFACFIAFCLSLIVYIIDAADLFSDPNEIICQEDIPLLISIILKDTIIVIITAILLGIFGG